VIQTSLWLQPLEPWQIASKQNLKTPILDKQLFQNKMYFKETYKIVCFESFAAILLSSPLHQMHH
jgi:hypothetical protein